ncbi:hypothetical protein BHF71_02975 [Vulcanibacillus modesticaldus]|uniref:Peptidoglycan endopeptidase n=1 Tax=Vulcanibacillus modesticaldus TaxID=337097 RepID=A0A1D2YTB8_9BACI|nr:C40 family peptidase [Vulcanibacillus modesticaldus]OEF98905.1 hypothetical protein BHF71_02975 [Vulcanibacillus modesticaldus]
MKRVSFFLAIFLAVSVLLSGVASAATYTVKSGDNLWQIAQKFGTGPTALMRANGMKSTMIYPGQKIQVPDKYTHFVNYGDTLWRIAQKYGVSLSDIIKLNGLKNPGNLFVGQKIKIPQKTGWKAKADQLIQAGMKYLGRPYEFGASNRQTRTFDCSSFTQRAFADIGIKIKRSSRSQYAYPPGRYIKRSEIRRGDLLFFDYTRDGKIDHVAIYYGNNKLLHTYRNPQGVEVSPLSKYWQSRYVGAKRIIE